MHIVKITRDSYTTEDGAIHPIDPPLEEAMSVEEFEKHYDFAVKVVKSCRDVGSDNSDT